MVQNLAKFAYNFLSVSEKIRSDIDDFVLKREEGSSPRAEIVKFSVIRLVDQWGRFSRDVILASASGTCVSATGQALNGSYPTIKAAALFARTNHKGNVGNETRWHDHGEAIRVANKLQIPNRVEVVAALGASNSPSEILRLMRNHFAHESSKDCFEKLSNKDVAIVSKGPINYILEFHVNGKRRYEHWIGLLQSISVAAAS